MNRYQRVRYEMFVRVRNFGAANRERFPESSAAGKMFTKVGEAVAAIDGFLVRRAQARTEARRVKAATRGAVMRTMRAIVATGRRAATDERVEHPFRLPVRKSAAAVLSAARMFVEEAERRRDRFVELGMPATFVADFRTLIGDLQQAVEIQHDSRGSLASARCGFETAMQSVLTLLPDLDVTMANMLRDDPTAFAHWEGARRVDTHVTSSSVPQPEAIASPAPALPLERAS